MKKTEPKMGITRRSFQKWGSEGGKIGGAKNKEKKGYFSKIGKLGGRPKDKCLYEIIDELETI